MTPLTIVTKDVYNQIKAVTFAVWIERKEEFIMFIHGWFYSGISPKAAAASAAPEVDVLKNPTFICGSSFDLWNERRCSDILHL